MTERSDAMTDVEPAAPGAPEHDPKGADVGNAPSTSGGPGADARRRRAGAGGGGVAEHAVLGLLALAPSAGHGYDLARHFASGRPLGAVIRLAPGMLYHHLKKLEGAGWASAVTEETPGRPGRPARQVYAVTPAGEAELRRWLTEPVARTREVRIDFLVKLYLARWAPDGAAVVARLVAEQRATLVGLEESLRRQLAARPAGAGPATEGASPTPGARFDADFGRLVLELRLAQTHAALGWLDRVEMGAGWGSAAEETGK